MECRGFPSGVPNKPATSRGCPCSQLWKMQINGILAAYLANLLRMFIIVMVGHYRGSDALMWAHANAGWLIYMAWIALFWWLLFRWFFKQQAMGSEGGDDPSPAV